MIDISWCHDDDVMIYILYAMAYENNNQIDLSFSIHSNVLLLIAIVFYR